MHIVRLEEQQGLLYFNHGGYIGGLVSISVNACDKLVVTGLEGYINIYIYEYFTVIRGPRVHQSLTGSSIY